MYITFIVSMNLYRFQVFKTTVQQHSVLNSNLTITSVLLKINIDYLKGICICVLKTL